MLDLDGLWEFAWTKNNSEKPNYDSFAAVPGCFDAEGQRFNRRGIGWYRRKITVSVHKQRLKIGSFGLHAKVFLDGMELAESHLAWSPLTVDFTAESGEHELVIRTDNFVEGHPVFKERYDFYGFGGIFDHVTLSEVPLQEIRRLEILPLDHTTGEILLRIETEASILKISFDGSPEQIFENTKELRLKVPDFKIWSPDHPFLHKIQVNERIEEFGIRTLDWSGPRLKLNGEEAEALLKLAGYAFSPNDPDDLVVKFCLENGIRDIPGINYMLYRYANRPLNEKNDK